MKKMIVSALLLVTSCLSIGALAGSSYADCPTTDSNNKFCQCFYNNCNKVFGSGQCQYPRLVAYFRKIGPANACRAQGRGTNQQQCVAGIEHFEQVCG